jgi:hypothetical protein
MSQSKLNTHQSGVALILALLLLFVLTLVAVASFSSSHVQERAAGNNRLQTLAYEAAAAGANNSIEFFLSNASAHAPDLDCGAADHPGWYDGSGDPIMSDWIPVTYAVSDVSLNQRMYCLVDEYPCDEDEPGCDTGVIRAPRSQLFVLSRGEALAADGTTVVAFREIETRIDRRNNTSTAEGCGAICFPACDYLVDNKGDPRIDFPSSNVFQIDGGGGSAVTTGLDCDDSALLDTILGDIKDSRLGNYDGGLHQQDPGEPWNDEQLTENYRSAVEAASMVAPHLHVDGNLVDMGNTVYGTLEAPMITYVAGDLAFGGGISGAGIVMVEGSIAWNGTPDFKGLIISLGGSYTIDGGGTGGNHAGSVVVLNTTVPYDGSTPFGGIAWENTGGGTAEYNWDCDALMMAFKLVDDAGQPGNYDSETPWGFDCERGPPTLFESPVDLIIASWRENLGWRTDEFSAP